MVHRLVVADYTRIDCCGTDCAHNGETRLSCLGVSVVALSRSSDWNNSIGSSSELFIDLTTFTEMPMIARI